MDSATHTGAERALELPQGETNQASQLLARQWFLEIVLHRFQNGERLFIGDAEAKAKIHSLGANPFAHIGVQEPVADGRAKLRGGSKDGEGGHDIEAGAATP